MAPVRGTINPVRPTPSKALIKEVPCQVFFFPGRLLINDVRHFPTLSFIFGFFFLPSFEIEGWLNLAQLDSREDVLEACQRLIIKSGDGEESPDWKMLTARGTLE